MTLFSEPRIVFHHIPKCGGMSVVAGLGITYYPLRILRYGRKGFPGLLNARATSQAAQQAGMDVYAYRRLLLGYYLERGDSPFIPGHYPFSRDLHEAYKTRYHFVTLLRDPVKRWYSEYYWNRYKDHEYARTELDMEEYLESPAGRMNARSYLNFLSPAADTAEAIGNLECFTVLGVLEDLGRFQSDMKAAFGRKPFIFKRNASPAPQEARAIPDKDSAFHKKLLEMLAGDIAVYEAARKTLRL